MAGYKPTPAILERMQKRLGHRLPKSDLIYLCMFEERPGKFTDAETRQARAMLRRYQRAKLKMEVRQDTPGT